MKQLNTLLRLLFAMAAGLQVVLAVAVFPRAWWMDPDPGSWTRGIQQLLEEAR